MGFTKIVFFLLIAGSLFAENTLSDNFFGYKKIVSKEQKKEIEEKDKFSKYNFVVTNELLDSLTPDEYRKLLSEVKDVAVKRQSDQDIKNLFVMQIYQEKKADEFTKKTQLIKLENQEYDTSLGIAKSKYAKNVQAMANEQKEQSFDDLIKDNAILVVFYDENEEVENRGLEMVLNLINQEKGIQAQFINISDGFGKEFAEKNKISFTPDLWILYKSKKPIWHRLTSGVTTKNRIYSQLDFVYKNYIIKELEK